MYLSNTLLLHYFLLSLLFLTSVLMASGLFPSLPSKCSGESMVPSWRKSASFNWSVSVVAEMPASGPRLGREPAASAGSGICPGIMSDTATTAAVGREEKEWEERLLTVEVHHFKCVFSFWVEAGLCTAEYFLICLLSSPNMSHAFFPFILHHITDIWLFISIDLITVAFFPQKDQCLLSLSSTALLNTGCCFQECIQTPTALTAVLSS